MIKYFKKIVLYLLLTSLILGNFTSIYASKLINPSTESITEDMDIEINEESITEDEVFEPEEPQDLNPDQSQSDNSNNSQAGNDFEAPEATISNQELKEAKSEPIDADKSADFVFIIDSTGSMRGYIDSVRSNLTAFVQYLNAKGVDIRISIIDYKDILEDGPQSTTVHNINGSQWSNNLNDVINTFSSISVTGGGDDPETPSEALGKIVDLGNWKWREDTSKFAFLLTDADFKDNFDYPDVPGMNNIIGALRNYNIQVSVVSKMTYEPDYNNLYSLTGGKFIDIDSTDYYKLMIEVADWIFEALEDSDSDGLPDEWETKGVDVNNDGKIDIPLHEMGANPNKKDIFIEIDWMRRPKENDSFLWWDIEKVKEKNFAPSEDALKMAYEQFKKHDINLHIDAGPNSTDYVTGKKWGDLSGGNELPYSHNLNLGDTFENWNSMAVDYFDRDKWNIFRYCMFINDYNNSGSSGIAENIPGQFFIVSGDWLHDLGDSAVARTFMHELGHTLGLCHGGSDHINYKPNYLSIMNYSFQLTGLLGNDSLTYSEHILPELDESNLDENTGVDPNGVTNGTNLGTKWKYYNEGLFGLLFSGEKDKKGYGVAKKPLDFNNNESMETNISEDLNGDGNKNILSASIKDWDSLVFKGGLIGGRGDGITDKTTLISKNPSIAPMDELDFSEAIENGLLGNPGNCIIENVTPNALYSNEINQKIYVKVNNLYQDTSTPILKVSSPLVDGEFSKEISIPGSKKEISSKLVEIPVKKNIRSGNYDVNCVLTLEDGKEIPFETSIKVSDIQTVTIRQGEHKDLIPDEDLKDLNFTWNSSNTSVVEIENGIVTGKKIGKSIISGTLTNGEKIICVVNVIDLNHVHKYSSNWSNSPTYHYHECSCGDKIDVSKHSFGKWVETKAPTNTIPGSKERVCSICNYKEVVKVPALNPSADTGDKSYLPVIVLIFIGSLCILIFAIKKRKNIDKE